MREPPLTYQKKSKILQVALGLQKKQKRSLGTAKVFSGASTKISPYAKKIKRFAKLGIKSLLLSPRFHSACKVVTTVAVIVIVLYGSYLYIGKLFANEVIVSQSEIISRVGKLVLLPNEDPYEIVRVQDQNDLRKQNPFYQDVEEGDYILMYKNLAVVYDLQNNVIVALKRD